MARKLILPSGVVVIGTAVVGLVAVGVDAVGTEGVVCRRPKTTPRTTPVNTIMITNDTIAIFFTENSDQYVLTYFL